MRELDRQAARADRPRGVLTQNLRADRGGVYRRDLDESWAVIAGPLSSISGGGWMV